MVKSMETKIQTAVNNIEKSLILELLPIKNSGLQGKSTTEIARL
jgi:hypothetical protein